MKGTEKERETEKEWQTEQGREIMNVTVNSE